MCVMVCCLGADCSHTPVPDPHHFKLVDENGTFVSVFVHMHTSTEVGVAGSEIRGTTHRAKMKQPVTCILFWYVYTLTSFQSLVISTTMGVCSEAVHCQIL